MTAAESIVSKRRWAASAVVAAVVVVAVLALMRAPIALPPGSRIEPPDAARAGSAVQVVASISANEEAIMRDQRPLFLPTERNATLAGVRPPESGRAILDREVAQPIFEGVELAISLPPPMRAPPSAWEAGLADAATTPLYGLGRAARPIAPEPARGAFVQVFAAANNERVLAEALPVDARPSVSSPWRPMEFLAAVDPAGLVGQLKLTASSDVDEVDNHFRFYLASSFRIGDRLRPGFYRIVVAP
jgi:hypothetical protein